jgi:hypothetical protein
VCGIRKGKFYLFHTFLASLFFLNNKQKHVLLYFRKERKKKKTLPRLGKDPVKEQKPGEQSVPGKEPGQS